MTHAAAETPTNPTLLHLALPTTAPHRSAVRCLASIHRTQRPEHTSPQVCAAQNRSRQCVCFSNSTHNTTDKSASRSNSGRSLADAMAPQQASTAASASTDPVEAFLPVYWKHTRQPQPHQSEMNCATGQPGSAISSESRGGSRRSRGLRAKAVHPGAPTASTPPLCARMETHGSQGRDRARASRHHRAQETRVQKRGRWREKVGGGDSLRSRTHAATPGCFRACEPMRRADRSMTLARQTAAHRPSRAPRMWSWAAAAMALLAFFAACSSLGAGVHAACRWESRVTACTVACGGGTQWVKYSCVCDPGSRGNTSGPSTATTQPQSQCPGPEPATYARACNEAPCAYCHAFRFNNVPPWVPGSDLLNSVDLLFNTSAAAATAAGDLVRDVRRFRWEARDASVVLAFDGSSQLWTVTLASAGRAIARTPSLPPFVTATGSAALWDLYDPTLFSYHPTRGVRISCTSCNAPPPLHTGEPLFYLSKDACSQVRAQCRDVNDQLVVEAAPPTPTSDRVCSTAHCTSNCLNCTRDAACVLCPDGTFLHHGQCVSSCPTPMHGDPITRSCRLCGENMYAAAAAGDEASADTQCLACTHPSCYACGANDECICDLGSTMLNGECFHTAATLTVYVSPEPGTSFNSSDFRSFLSETLEARVYFEFVADASVPISVTFSACRAGSRLCLASGLLESILFEDAILTRLEQQHGYGLALSQYNPGSSSTTAVPASSSSNGLSDLVYIMIGVGAFLFLVVVGFLLSIACTCTRSGSTVHLQLSNGKGSKHKRSKKRKESRGKHGRHANAGVVSTARVLGRGKAANALNALEFDENPFGTLIPDASLASAPNSTASSLCHLYREVLLWWKSTEFVRGVGLSKAGRPYAWFLGLISTERSEQILLLEGCDGAFHIRVSRQFKGYILSVRHGDHVSHFDVHVLRRHRYRIAGDAGGRARHKSLRSVVHYHARVPIKGAGYLRRPCGDRAMSYHELVRTVRSMTTTADIFDAAAILALSQQDPRDHGRGGGGGGGGDHDTAEPSYYRPADGDDDSQVYYTLEELGQQSEPIYETLSETERQMRELEIQQELGVQSHERLQLGSPLPASDGHHSDDDDDDNNNNNNNNNNNSGGNDASHSFHGDDDDADDDDDEDFDGHGAGELLPIKAVSTRSVDERDGGSSGRNNSNSKNNNYNGNDDDDDDEEEGEDGGSVPASHRGSHHLGRVKHRLQRQMALFARNHPSTFASTTGGSRKQSTLGEEGGSAGSSSGGGSGVGMESVAAPHHIRFSTAASHADMKGAWSVFLDSSPSLAGSGSLPQTLRRTRSLPVLPTTNSMAGQLSLWCDNGGSGHSDDSRGAGGAFADEKRAHPHPASVLLSLSQLLLRPHSVGTTCVHEHEPHLAAMAMFASRRANGGRGARRPSGQLDWSPFSTTCNTHHEADIDHAAAAHEGEYIDVGGGIAESPPTARACGSRTRPRVCLLHEDGLGSDADVSVGVARNMGREERGPATRSVRQPRQHTGGARQAAPHGAGANKNRDSGRRKANVLRPKTHSRPVEVDTALILDDPAGQQRQSSGGDGDVSRGFSRHMHHRRSADERLLSRAGVLPGHHSSHPAQQQRQPGGKKRKPMLTDERGRALPTRVHHPQHYRRHSSYRVRRKIASSGYPASSPSPTVGLQKRPSSASTSQHAAAAGIRCDSPSALYTHNAPDYSDGSLVEALSVHRPYARPVGDGLPPPPAYPLQQQQKQRLAHPPLRRHHTASPIGTHEDASQAQNDDMKHEPAPPLILRGREHRRTRSSAPMAGHVEPSSYVKHVAPGLPLESDA